MRNLKYVGFFDVNNFNNEKRVCFPAAVNKMSYIASTINESGYDVQIISPSWSANHAGFYKKRITLIQNGVELIIGNTFGANNFFSRKLRIIYSLLYLFFYLLFHAKKNENIIVYHSLMLIIPILLIKKLKKVKVILEVEEVYQDVILYTSVTRKLENKMIKNADKYIFSSELLNEKLNSLNKPYVIIHGTYKSEDDRKCRFNDGKIHCVYAGTFDPRKGGAITAAAIAQFLPENFHVHIIGFGSEKEKENLFDFIKLITSKSKCSLTYDGCLLGEDYIKFIQSCDIGLSTQNPEAKFNDTSFPSKILSYMANGLIVISIRIKVLECSSVNDLIYYYDEVNPQKIAELITSVNIDINYNSRNRIQILDKEFINNIHKILIDQ